MTLFPALSHGRGSNGTNMALSKDTGVYVTLSKKVPLDDYLSGYLKSRGWSVDPNTLSKIRTWVARMPKSGALKKADLDFYLDKNLKR